MHIIIGVVVLFILYKIFKNYLVEIIFLGGILLALIYYTEITIYSLIGLFFLFFIYSKINESNLKKECISLLVNNNFDGFFEKYFNYDASDKKTIINIISKDFQKSDEVLSNIFRSELLKFGLKKTSGDDQIIFDKKECFTELLKVWEDKAELFLDLLIKEPNSDIQYVIISGSNNKKTHLIKIISKKEGADSIGDFDNAISLDD